MFFFSSRRRHTRFDCDWSSDVCSSDLKGADSAQNTWNMDGVNITDMGATGSSPLYFDFDSFEEMRSEEHTSELQSQSNLVCRLLLEKKKKTKQKIIVNETKKYYQVCDN